MKYVIDYLYPLTGDVNFILRSKTKDHLYSDKLTNLKRCQMVLSRPY